MAEQPGELRQIDWDQTFPFTRPFKSFRMAIQPGKLALALAGVILMGIWGGVLDGVWRMSSSNPVGAEVWSYWQVPDIDSWRQVERDSIARQLSDLYGPTGPKTVKEALAKIRHDARTATPAVARECAIQYRQLEAYHSRGIFGSFLKYERDAVANFLYQAGNVFMLDFGAVTRGTEDVLAARRGGFELRQADNYSGIGMLASVVLMYRGVQWMLAEHFIYAMFLLFGSLAIWSVFGGAVCRMAALNVARDEQIAPKAALSFAVRKFVGFFSAPLLPAVFILLIGIPLWVGGLFFSIPYVGDLIGGILVVLALLGGFVMAMVAIGAFFGGSLLWPTVAVEGSDGFDAMSRSYSYFYSRPWRYAFYTIVSAIYGAVTYLVLRYFVYVLVMLTRTFVGWGTFPTSRPGLGIAGASKIDAVWPLPSPNNLLGECPIVGMQGGDALSAWLIHLWLLLLVLMLCAYLVSFYFSASTVIYYLLRQKVDATDFEDVYIEEEEASAGGLPSVSGESAGAAPAAGAASGETGEPKV